MWNSSEEPSKSIAHQVASLNHSLLWVFAAVGPAGQLPFGLMGLFRPKATPVSKTSTQMPTISVVQTLLRLSIRVIHAFHPCSSCLTWARIPYTNQRGSATRQVPYI